MAVKKITIDGMDFDINYEIINPKNEKDLIILHGWGSNKEIMRGAFCNTLPNFRHIYIDMPGFGKSSNDYILDTRLYSSILNQFLNKLDAKKDIIMGHSFGGKVATLLKPNLLVLLSSSGILVPKPFDVRMKIAIFKALKSIGGGSLARFFASKDVDKMSQNMYETFKKVVNEDFSDIFKSYDKEAVLFWGKDDTATPLWSGKRISELIKDSSLYPLDGDHFFFTKHSGFIEKVIDGKV